MRNIVFNSSATSAVIDTRESSKITLSTNVLGIFNRGKTLLTKKSRGNVAKKKINS